MRFLLGMLMGMLLLIGGVVGGHFTFWWWSTQQMQLHVAAAVAQAQSAGIKVDYTARATGYPLRQVVELNDVRVQLQREGAQLELSLPRGLTLEYAPLLDLQKIALRGENVPLELKLVPPGGTVSATLLQGELRDVAVSGLTLASTGVPSLTLQARQVTLTEAATRLKLAVAELTQVVSLNARGIDWNTIDLALNHVLLTVPQGSMVAEASLGQLRLSGNMPAQLTAVTEPLTSTVTMTDMSWRLRNVSGTTAADSGLNMSLREARFASEISPSTMNVNQSTSFGLTDLRLDEGKGAAPKRLTNLACTLAVDQMPMSLMLTLQQGQLTSPTTALNQVVEAFKKGPMQLAVRDCKLLMDDLRGEMSLQLRMTPAGMPDLQADLQLTGPAVQDLLSLQQTLLPQLPMQASSDTLPTVLLQVRSTTDSLVVNGTPVMPLLPVEQLQQLFAQMPLVPMMPHQTSGTLTMVSETLAPELQSEPTALTQP